MRRLAILLVLLGWGTVANAAHPVFFSSAEEKAIRAQMLADYKADPDCSTVPTTVNSAACAPATYGGQIYKLIHDYGASDNYYDYSSMTNAFQYRVCKDVGDPQATCDGYLNLVWNRLTVEYLAQAETVAGMCSYGREKNPATAMVFDWIYDGLTVERKNTLMTKLEVMMNICYTGGFSWADSDEAVGDYSAAAMLECSFGAESATIDGYWNDAARKIGGYTATAQDRATQRNAVSMYVGLASGGEWLESEHYNLNTVKGLAWTAAVRSCRGSEDYPEITAWFPDWAENIMLGMTTAPDFVNGKVYHWGDEEKPRLLTTPYRWETSAMVAGILQGTPVGERLQDWIFDYLDSSPTGLAEYGFNPSPRYLFTFNPYATRGDHKTGPVYTYASGEGMVKKKTSLTSSSTDQAFYAHFPGYIGPLPATKPGEIQHTPFYYGEFQWWRGTGANGEWIMTHPLGYGWQPVDWRGTNGVGLYGMARSSGINFSPAIQYQSVQAEEDDTTNGFTYVTGTMGGVPGKSALWGGADPYVMEYTRSLVWMPDLLFVWDRANVKNPVTQGYYSQGYTAAQKTVVSSSAPVVARFHMPVEPTLGAGYTQWSLSHNGNVRIDHLYQTGAAIVANNESTDATWTASSVAASELKWDITITPATPQQWNTLLNVIQRYDSTPYTVTAIEDAAHAAQGALVAYGTTNKLVMFNAIQGPDVPNCSRTGSVCNYPTGTDTILDVVRLRTTGYSIGFTAAVGSTTKALLFDLDDGIEWTYKVNGGAETPLTPDADGVGVVDISATGAVTLDVLAGGAIPDDPTVVSTSSLPVGVKGTAYSKQLVSIGGAGSPTWDITVGALQTGLSMNAAGLISGTPTVASTVTPTFRSCDPSPNCGTRGLALTITDVPTITTTALDDCSLGSAYSDTLEAVGGTEPYAWTLTDGTLPEGLSLAAATGVISGTCTGALGLSQLEFTVTDDAAVADAKSLGITVIPGLPNMTVKVEPGSTSAVAYMGIIGLPYGDSCDMILKDGDTTVATNTIATGLARRGTTFTGLQPDRTYGIDGVCGTAVTQERTYFQTLTPTTGGRQHKLKVRAPGYVLQAVPNPTLEVTYTPATGDAVVVTKAYSTCDQTTHICATSADLAAQMSYSYYYRWLDGATPLVSTAGRKGYLAVP